MTDKTVSKEELLADDEEGAEGTAKSDKKKAAPKKRLPRLTPPRLPKAKTLPLRRRRLPPRRRPPKATPNNLLRMTEIQRTPGRNAGGFLIGDLSRSVQAPPPRLGDTTAHERRTTTRFVAPKVVPQGRRTAGVKV